MERKQARNAGPTGIDAGSGYERRPRLGVQKVAGESANKAGGSQRSHFYLTCDGA